MRIDLFSYRCSNSFCIIINISIKYNNSTPWFDTSTLSKSMIVTHYLQWVNHFFILSRIWIRCILIMASNYKLILVHIYFQSYSFIIIWSLECKHLCQNHKNKQIDESTYQNIILPIKTPINRYPFHTFIAT
jgi:hypothetical protein